MEEYPFPRLAETVLDDHALAVSWSKGGELLAAMPSEGRTTILQSGSAQSISLPPHQGGNGTAAWHPHDRLLATYGQDRIVRLFEPPFSGPLRSFKIEERGWAERMEWNPAGTLLAVAAGRSVCVIDPTSGGTHAMFPDHKSTVSDLSWNPARDDEIAVVCDGGLRIWRVGNREPVGAFDWGGASLKVSWSPDGRWVVTGDQTPSVHIYEVATETPLHIQGFGAKAKAFAWQGSGKRLAIASGPTITVWPCTGKKGPNGAKPILLEGHRTEISVLQFLNNDGLLLSCGRDGAALLWMTHKSEQPALLLHSPHGFSTASFAPGTNHLATGDESGRVFIWNLIAQLSSLSN